jgi:hypothetical protein
MGEQDYKRTLESAKAEMSELVRQKNEIEARVAKLAPVIEYLAVLCDDKPNMPLPDKPITSDSELGLTDAIRLAFKSAVPNSLTPTEVRDKLKEIGFPLDKYKSELPPIHNTISRLKEKGELEEYPKPNGEKALRWVSSLKRALLEMEPITPIPHFDLSQSIVLGQWLEQEKSRIAREVDEQHKRMLQNPILGGLFRPRKPREPELLADEIPGEGESLE